MTKRYDPTPVFVDLIPVGPIRSTPFVATTPLVRVATDVELRETTVVDPVLGDTITCAELQQRDNDCWRQLDAQYPPKFAFALTAPERQRVAAARATCRRRGQVLVHVCRVGVRAG